MASLRALVPALPLMLALAGCGGLGEPAVPGLGGSCNHPTYCDDYYDMPASHTGMNRDRCPTVDQGVWSDTRACSRADTIGGCRYQLSNVPGQRIEWYR